MPYPNEHSCRLAEPGEFQPNSFRRINHGDKIEIIIGKMRGKSTTTTQALRYPVDKWTPEDAQADCEKRGGKFEAAKE